MSAPTLNLVATEGSSGCHGCAFEDGRASSGNCAVVPCCIGETLPDGTELQQNIVWMLPEELKH